MTPGFSCRLVFVGPCALVKPGDDSDGFSNNLNTYQLSEFIWFLMFVPVTFITEHEQPTPMAGSDDDDQRGLRSWTLSPLLPGATSNPLL